MISSRDCTVHGVKCSTAYNRRRCRCEQCKAYASERSAARGRPVSQKRASRADALDAVAKFHATIAEHGDGIVFEGIAAGETIISIAKRYGISRTALMRWCTAPERKDAWDAARRASAEALVEMGTDIIDSAKEETNTARVTNARDRAAWRRWLASIRDPERYGEPQQGGVVVNIGALHLDALRHSGSVAALPAAAVPALASGAIVDAEIVED